MQDTWSDNENEDIDLAIAMFLEEKDKKGKKLLVSFIVLVVNTCALFPSWWIRNMYFVITFGCYHSIILCCMGGLQKYN